MVGVGRIPLGLGCTHGVVLAVPSLPTTSPKCLDGFFTWGCIDCLQVQIVTCHSYSSCKTHSGLSTGDPPSVLEPSSFSPDDKRCASGVHKLSVILCFLCLTSLASLMTSLAVVLCSSSFTKCL